MLALFAGLGRLPGAIFAQLPDRPFVFALDGFPPDELTPDVSFRIEHLGTMIADLVARGTTEVCFAGAIARPVIDPSTFDVATLPLVPRMQAAMTAGDDGALRVLIALFEEAGLTVRGAHEIAPDLLPPPGVLTTGRPLDGYVADAKRGAQIVAAMSVVDVGQACVVHRGQSLAIEGVFGTDWMLASLAHRPDEGQGGILFKAPKPGQDRRADLPVIGPGTVRGAVVAGLDGIVIEAGGVMILDRDQTQSLAEDLGLFLWVREASEP